MAEITEEIKELGDKMANLTLLQATALSGYLKDTHGIEAASGGGGPGPTNVPKEPDAPAQTTFDVVLKAAGDKKIQVIKVVREVTGLGLKEAKDLVDGAPKAVKTNLEKAEAEALKKKLEAEGATVELK